MLIDNKRDCVFNAKRLGDYQSIDIDTLATKYCEAIDKKDGAKQNSYLAALILRFWYVIDKLYKNNMQLKLDREDYFNWVVEGIQLACKYRGWLNPDKKVNAQACINRAIATVRVRYYYTQNLDKSKINYGNIVSLDQEVGTTRVDTHSITIADTIVDEAYDERVNYDESADTVRSYIQSMINNNKYIDAIILDRIAFGDTMKQKCVRSTFVNDEGEKVRAKETYTEFSDRNLIKELSNLPESFDRYFTNTYTVAVEPLNASLSKIRGTSKQTLRKYMVNCLTMAKRTVKQALYN